MGTRGHWSSALRSIGTLACVLLIYYGVPLDWGADAGRAADVVGLIVFIVGLAGVILLLRHQVRRFVRAGHQHGQVQAVLSALYVIVGFFALFYYMLETNSPGQFEGLETRTDSMYFTIVTLGTVGYGDINAVGQIARIATMIQVVFDLVVIGTLLAVAAPGIAKGVVQRASDTNGESKPSDD